MKKAPETGALDWKTFGRPGGRPFYFFPPFLEVPFFFAPAFGLVALFID